MRTIDELNEEVEVLNKKQGLIRFLSFLTAIGGLLFFLFGFWWKYYHPEWNLEDMGSFLAGSAGSAWGFSGLLFIYLGFLGQKQEIKNQQIELILTREEMEAGRIELSGQKEQLGQQKQSLDQQTNALLSQVTTIEKQEDYRTVRELLNDVTSSLYSRYNQSENNAGLVKFLLERVHDYVSSNSYDNFSQYYVTFDSDAITKANEVLEFVTNKYISIHFKIAHGALGEKDKAVLLNDFIHQVGLFFPDSWTKDLELLDIRDESGMPIEKVNDRRLKFARHLYRTNKELSNIWNDVSVKFYEGIGDYSLNEKQS